jgi:hypothetical protein
MITLKWGRQNHALKFDQTIYMMIWVMMGRGVAGGDECIGLE